MTSFELFLRNAGVIESCHGEERVIYKGMEETPPLGGEVPKSSQPVEPVKEEVAEYSAHSNPRTKKSDLEACRFDYEIGNYKSIAELAKRYGINEKTLYARIEREYWERSRLERLSRLESKMEKVAVNIGEEYLKNTFSRMKKYEKLLDASIESIGNVIDPDTLNTLTLTEARIHEVSKSALRIPDAKAIDITSKGQSLGESFTTALQKLRENGQKTHELTPEDVKRISEAEIIE